MCCLLVYHIILCLFIYFLFFSVVSSLKIHFKFWDLQNSKFLQFVSKMSRGELIIDDNQVKPGASSSSGDWAGEFQQQYSGGLNWADQFVHDAVSINLVKNEVSLPLSFLLSLQVLTKAENLISEKIKLISWPKGGVTYLHSCFLFLTSLIWLVTFRPLEVLRFLAAFLSLLLCF